MKKNFWAVLAVSFALACVAGCGEEPESVLDGPGSVNEIELDVSDNGIDDKDTSEQVLGEGLVQIGQYKGLTVEAEKYNPSEAEVKETASYFYSEEARNFTWNKEAAENGDIVIIDYVGKLDGVEFEGGSDTDYALELGSGSFIEGFEEGLIGAKEGEVRDLNLKFPDEYHNADLAGKMTVFTVTVHKIIPPMSDDTIMALQSPAYTNVQEFMEQTKQTIIDYYSADYETTVITGVIDQITKSSTWGTLPEDKMAEQREVVKTTYFQVAEQYGLDVETYLAMYGTDLDTLAGLFVKRDLIMDKIAELEGLVATDEEMDRGIQEMIDNYYQDGSTVEDFYAQRDKEEYREYCTLQKVYNFLLENTNVVAPAGFETVSGAE